MNNKNINEIIKKILDEYEKKKNNREELKSISLEDNYNLSEYGIYENIEYILKKTNASQKEYEKKKLAFREHIVTKIKEELKENIHRISELFVSLKDIGNIKDQITKNLISINSTPMLEDLKTDVYTGDNGLSLVERSPFGVVIASISDNDPIASTINVVISSLIAGNSIVIVTPEYNKQIMIELIKTINTGISKCGDSCKHLVSLILGEFDSNLIKGINSNDVKLVLFDDIEKIKNIPVDSSVFFTKKILISSKGRTPVIIDETADIKKAAKDMYLGASFNNGNISVRERVVFAMDSIKSYLVFCLKELGCKFLEKEEIEKLSKLIYSSENSKNYESKSATSLLKDACISFEGEPKLIIFETTADNIFITQNKNLPILPIIKYENFNSLIRDAIHFENGQNHCAVIHSQNISRLNYVAKTLKTGVFVKNGSSLSGIGFDGEGHTGFLIDGVKGNGILSAKDFTRIRRCVLKDSFSIK